MLLDKKTALLEYVIGDSLVHIFYIDKKTIEWKKSFVKRKLLTSNIKILHDALSGYRSISEDKAYKDYIQKAHWFYQMFVLPVLKDKSHINNLIIVTDGELGHLPFESFLVKEAPQSSTDFRKLHYLINDYSISYNYSATLWKENKETAAPQNNGQILGIAANYDIKLDSTMSDVRLPSDQWIREGLKPLPFACKEVESLKKNYQGYFAFDTLASEKTVKEKASDFAILHFATHGVLDYERPILSSLAFSEDNDSIESNFWQAYEISKIELNANLVVLSACQTGYGIFEKGNGTASLARSFMYAGATSLIVSLWQVNDFATSEIMNRLYANLANGMKKDAALRQSKLEYIKFMDGVMGHPAFWSPFIMIGNTEPILIKRRNTFNPWTIVGFITILASIGIIVIVRNKLS